jgi:hypothetical protein
MARTLAKLYNKLDLWLSLLPASRFCESCRMKLSHKKCILLGDSSSALGLWNVDGKMIFYSCPSIPCQVWTAVFFQQCSSLLGEVESMWVAVEWSKTFHNLDFDRWNSLISSKMRIFQNQAVSSKGSPGSTVYFRGANTGTIWRRWLSIYPFKPQNYGPST